MGFDVEVFKYVLVYATEFENWSIHRYQKSAGLPVNRNYNKNNNYTGKPPYLIPGTTLLVFTRCKIAADFEIFSKEINLNKKSHIL